MRTYAYKTVMGHRDYPEVFEEALNELGAQGWRVVSSNLAPAEYATYLYALLERSGPAAEPNEGRT